MKKYQIYALIALAILLYWFVIPAVLTHDVPELAKQGKPIPKIAYKVWDYYMACRYVSPSTPPEALDKNKNPKLTLLSSPPLRYYSVGFCYCFCYCYWF